jgi:hypothetical protein
MAGRLKVCVPRDVPVDLGNERLVAVAEGSDAHFGRMKSGKGANSTSTL